MAAEEGDRPVAVQVRGIYTTALTGLFESTAGTHVVRASEPIRDRFDAAFPLEPEDCVVATTDDRQGVGATGYPDAVDSLDDHLRIGLDTLAWDDPAPEGAVFDGVVTDTLGCGAVLELGEGADGSGAEGWLPYGASDDYVEEDTVLRVQVTEPNPPWSGDRPELTTDLAADGGLVELKRGRSGDTSEAARMASLLNVETPEGWGPKWAYGTEEAGIDAMRDSLERATARVEALETALTDADPDDTPGLLYAPQATRWYWFGRDSRFALDDLRREVTTTMPGHHRTKATDTAASAAVDFAEAVCEPSGEFPFAAVTRQFGPREGDRVGIGHGKPEGRLITLGRGEVTEYDPEDGITLEREMSPGGSYDALGVKREAGDVAVTKFREGRWWYATVYRDDAGETKGTYVNVCTPLELFPDSVRYVDLHVDVVRYADGTVERVDDDELDEAVEAGYVPEPLAEKARDVATRVENAL
jgi:hypothetical protein